MLNRGASRIDKKTEAREPGAEHPESGTGNLGRITMPATSEGLDPRQLMGSGVLGDSFVGRGSAVADLFDIAHSGRPLGG